MKFICRFLIKSWVTILIQEIAPGINMVMPAQEEVNIIIFCHVSKGIADIFPLSLIFLNDGNRGVVA